MTTLTIVSDWHLGAIRSGGTTPATAYQLRQDLLKNAEDLLHEINGDLLVNGDLFDGPDIPRADLLQAVRIFSDWLGRPPAGHLFLANGNHDLDKNSTRLSSFQFFAQLLIEMHGHQRVTHIAEGAYLEKHDTYVIPHLANQDLFDMALEAVPPCTYLCVHCNYNNGFAVESDHSLNMSEEQAKALKVERIIFGHEHQQKIALGHKVIIVGNQFPSSVSDCLGNSDKQLVQISANGGEGVEYFTSWTAEGDYSEQDWRNLEDRGRFIRVSGTATAAEADQVVTALSRFRRDAKALVITNAVRIEGVDDAAELSLSHEEITNFNVQQALLDFLTPEEGAKITALLNKKNLEKKNDQ